MSQSGDSFDFNFEFAADLSIGGDPDVKQCLSLLMEAQGEEALDAVDRVRAREGATPLVRHLIALCICRMGRVVPAIHILRTAHDDAPQAFEHVEVLAALLTVAGKRSEGVYFAKLATALKPAYPDYELVPSWLITFNAALLVAADNPIVENGHVLIADGALDKAADNFVDAIDLDKNNIAAWEGLVEVNRLRNRPGDSLRAAEALCALKEEDPKAFRTLAQCQVGIGDVASGWGTVNECLSLSGPDTAMAQALPGLVRYDPSTDASLMKNLSDAWNGLADIQPEDINVTPRPNEDARFRVGILSGCIQAGSEKAAVLATIDECIGRASELYYYTNSDKEDAVSRRFRRSAARWREISRVDDETVARIIRNDEVQVLIDLDGYDWTGRPGVVARKPAPVTLCFLAQPGAVPGASQGVLAVGEPHLPGFQKTSDTGVSVDVGLSTWPLYADVEDDDDGSEEVNLGSGPMRILMNATAGQLSEEFLEDLANAVRKGMSATFTLRGDDPEDDLTTEILSDRFRKVGLDLATVVRHPRNVPLEALLDSADIVVDACPLPNPESVLAALRKNIPVLAREAESPMNGAVSSLLYSVGLAGWIAADRDAFSQKLADLSKDPDGLRSSRTDIREAVNRAGGLDERNKRGKAFADLFDRLLSEAAEGAQ